MTDPLLGAPWAVQAGDCRALLAALPDECVDTIVTSPPYNLGASPSAYEHPNSSKGLKFDWAGYGDDDRDCKPEPEYQAEQIAILTDLYRILKPGGSCWYVYKDRLWEGICHSPWAWLVHTPWTIRQQIIWDRGSTHNHHGYSFYHQHEYVFWLTKGVIAEHLGSMAAWSSIWRIPPVANSPHPAPFPLALAERCILASTQAGDLVLDPYAGSGTTGRAALRNDRRWLGMERQARWVAYCQQQLQAYQRPLFAGLIP